MPGSSVGKALGLTILRFRFLARIPFNQPYLGLTKAALLVKHCLGKLGVVELVIIPMWALNISRQSVGLTIKTSMVRLLSKNH